MYSSCISEQRLQQNGFEVIIDPRNGTVVTLQDSPFADNLGTSAAQEGACARPPDSAVYDVDLGLLPAPSPGAVSLRIARIYHGSYGDGPGRRSVVLFQGCPIRCHGCHVPHLHPFEGGALTTPEAVADALLDPAGEPRDGVSVMGGEPFAQPEALATLLQLLRGKTHRCVYSGYTYEALQRMARGQDGRAQAVAIALAETDLLVDGPFVIKLAEGAGLWRGSRNQRLIDLADGSGTV